MIFFPCLVQVINFLEAREILHFCSLVHLFLLHVIIAICVLGYSTDLHGTFFYKEKKQEVFDLKNLLITLLHTEGERKEGNRYFTENRTALNSS